MLINVKLKLSVVSSGFDLLEEFRVSESRGVRRVNGSDPETVAYRVNPSIHLRRTMRYCRPTVCQAAMLALWSHSCHS
ncbi:hypothetical protein N1851_030805 [Merluccius polli]|uniref:Uncharacterized protein n=1 Tax=Merluccius polli TaxID=89951 RepID=A0AA47NQH0_MERPO|nr:hypothetical protein N1851_030805 [Merluccius polli]